MSESPIETLDLTEELEFASQLAREAATIVNTFYVGSSEVRYKTDDEPVTEADRSANQHIVNRIRATYPDDGNAIADSMTSHGSTSPSRSSCGCHRR